MRNGYIQPDGTDRAKAAGAALAVHLLLGAAFLAGRALHIDRQRQDSLSTFDVIVPPPPPPVEQRPVAPAKAAPAPAGNKATANPIVAPLAKILTDQRVAAAPVAGPGAASGAGAASSGSGTGGGGTGTGLGDGGGGMVGARLLTGALSRGDYRQISELGSLRGAAELLLLVNTRGRVERCRALSSSGNEQVDATLCRLLADRARFAPAHSADGALYYQDVHYFPRWGR